MNVLYHVDYNGKFQMDNAYVELYIRFYPVKLHKIMRKLTFHEYKSPCIQARRGYSGRA